jgi:hypothetical protein
LPPGHSSSTADNLFIGWFGPRGRATILFAVLVLDEKLPGNDTIIMPRYLGRFTPRSLHRTAGRMGTRPARAAIVPRERDNQEEAPMTEEEDFSFTFSEEDFERRCSSEEPGPSTSRPAAQQRQSLPGQPQPQPLHAHASAPPLGRVRTELIPAERASAMTSAMALWLRGAMM